MDYIEILKATGRAILFVIWIWSMSKYFSKIVTYRKKYLCITIKEMETTNPFNCKRYRRIIFSNLNHYYSYEELTPIINKFPNLGIYIIKQIKIHHESDMIDLDETTIANYKSSKQVTKKFNL